MEPSQNSDLVLKNFHDVFFRSAAEKKMNNFKLNTCFLEEFGDVV